MRQQWSLNFAFIPLTQWIPLTRLSMKSILVYRWVYRSSLMHDWLGNLLFLRDNLWLLPWRVFSCFCRVGTVSEWLNDCEEFALKHAPIHPVLYYHLSLINALAKNLVKSQKNFNNYLIKWVLYTVCMWRHFCLDKTSLGNWKRIIGKHTIDFVENQDLSFHAHLEMLTLLEVLHVE